MTNIAELTDRAVIKIAGDEADPFLQNLVTCNISDLENGQSTFGGLLTPQGKILFEFIVQKTSAGFLLDCSSKSAEELSKRLMFYKLRAAVTIELQDTEVFARWGDPVPADGLWIADPRSIKLGLRSYSESTATNAELQDWHHHRITCGIPELGLDFDSADIFPHDALYDQYDASGVDFSKGCYVGQEVVSRMHHRGTARNRFVICRTVNGDDLPQRGTEIIADGRKIGSIGSHASSVGLAHVRWDRAEGARTNGQTFTAAGINVTLALPDFVNLGPPT